MNPKKKKKKLKMAAVAPPTPATTALPDPTPTGHPLFARIRLATASDIPNIHKLIHQLANFEHLSHHYTTEASSISSSLQ